MTAPRLTPLRLALLLGLSSLGALGCRAPAPSVRGIFSPPGSTRVPSPGTGSYLSSDGYYQAGPSATLSVPGGQPGLAPGGGPLVVPGTIAPNTTGATGAAGFGGATSGGLVLPAPPAMEIGAAPPRVRIGAGGATSPAYFPNTSVASAPRVTRDGAGVPVTDMTRTSEPGRFVVPGAVSQLPGSSAPILLPGQVTPLNNGAGGWGSRR